MRGGGSALMTPKSSPPWKRLSTKSARSCSPLACPDGAQRLLPDPGTSPELNAAAEQVLQSDESGTVKIDGTDWFLHAHNPPLRLIVVGAVHIAQALVPFATQCGFAIIVVDPRRSFASDERFPNVTVSTAWPDEAMDELRPDIPHRGRDPHPRPEA